MEILGSRDVKQKGRPDRTDPGGLKKNLGGALLSHGRLPQYPRHWGPSLPCSEWERVLPPRHGHQGKSLEDESVEPGLWLREEVAFPPESGGMKKTRTSLTDD